MNVNVNSLNPCCNGIYLIIARILILMSVSKVCLNPCCNGIYLIIKSVNEWKTKRLNPCCNGIYLIIK